MPTLGETVPEQYFHSQIPQFIIPASCNGWDVGNSSEMEVICLSCPAARLEHPSLSNLRFPKHIPAINTGVKQRGNAAAPAELWEPRPGCGSSGSSGHQESAGAAQAGRNGLLIPPGTIGALHRLHKARGRRSAALCYGLREVLRPESASQCRWKIRTWPS